MIIAGVKMLSKHLDCKGTPDTFMQQKDKSVTNAILMKTPESLMCKNAQLNLR